MRYPFLLSFVLAATLLTVACAAPGAASSGAADGAKAATVQPWDAVQFVAVDSTARGGKVFDTTYSEQPNDSEVLVRDYHNGAVSYTCMVGYSKGSKWAGVGLNVYLDGEQRLYDARAYKTMTIKLASQATRTLRIRLLGPDEATRMNGCYPIYVQNVTDKLAEYTIPISKFAAESWCGVRAQTVPSTMKQLAGFEIADVTIHNEPSKFSVGAIRLLP